MKQTAIRYPYYWLALLICISLSASAQKLPTVQQVGLYAPADIKVDGRATEWNNQFQAYNKSTSLFYSMVNNADNLYLTIQATNKIIVEKILGGGLTLTITAEKNKNIAPVIITSPIFPPPARASVSRKLQNTELPFEEELPGLNKDLITGFKEISVKGITAIQDTSVSVYNEFGIKASGLIDINKAYTYEFAIPIKYLNQLIGSAGVFNYNIRLNGVNLGVTRIRVNGQDVEMGSAAAATALARTPFTELSSPTDFSGSYTLIKK